MTDTLFEHERFGFALRVYPNRLEVTEGVIPSLRKVTTILLRNISGVEKDRAEVHLSVKTNDGKKYKWVTAPKTKELYEALMGLL